MNRHAAMGAAIRTSDVPPVPPGSEVACRTTSASTARLPRRLAGTDIPLSGRIVAVVDYLMP